MKTIIHNYGKIPEECLYEHGKPSVLDKYDLREIDCLELDEIWYWYAYGNYEGSGCILMRKGDLYDIDNLYHCSCNGPTDNISFSGVSLDELERKISPGFKKESMCLLEMAKGSKLHLPKHTITKKEAEMLEAEEQHDKAQAFAGY